MEISYIFLAVFGYAFAPKIYETFVSLLFEWQYKKLVKKEKEKEKEETNRS